MPNNAKINITIDLKAMAIVAVIAAVVGGGWLIYGNAEKERAQRSKESVDRLERDFERQKFNIKLITR